MAKRTSTRFTARMIEGAKPSEMPGFIEPQLATLKSKPPSGDTWVHEIKFDGYRVQTHLSKGRVTCFTRKGLDWTKRFPSIIAAFDLPVERAIFDGELVVIKDNRANFSELQADLASGRRDRLSYYVFDLLFLDGFDLRQSPLVERKRVLKMLFEETRLASPVFYSEHFEVDGAQMYENACRLNLEGIISKRINALYASERTESWLKIKCVQTARFPIVGFIPEQTKGISALHLAQKNGKELVYVGKVGTGFNRKSAADVRKKLEALVTPESRLTKKLRIAKTKWVEPKLLAEVEYRDITSDGLLRQSSFKGIS